MKLPWTFLASLRPAFAACHPLPGRPGVRTYQLVLASPDFFSHDVPVQVLFLAAGYACSNRILSRVLAFAVALNLSLVTFVIGASIAFLLARSVLPPSCTRKFFKHYAILDGRANTAVRSRGCCVLFLSSLPTAVSFFSLLAGVLKAGKGGTPLDERCITGAQR